MTRSLPRRSRREAEEKFFLYVFFYHMWTGLFNFFKD